ncbi:MAG: delta-60 repeat domain-containing protein [Flavobacteriales bacterium]|nr:delta-60 repeat domain-containing protein [Flavobacteriales bacterium]
MSLIRTIAILGTVLIRMLAPGTSVAQSGTNDTTFNPADIGFGNGDGADGRVKTINLQPDGRIIVGGEFTSYNGTLLGHIARLHPDGSLDTTFNPGSGADDFVNTTLIQPDGKVIIAGDFTSFNGVARNYIARLHPDGSLDTSFDPGAGADGPILTAALRPDGKIIIGGWFTTYEGVGRNRIARLQADGSLDASFDPGSGAGNSVDATTLQPDGKIIIGGYFTSYNGTGRNRIARLNADGTLDTLFNPGAGTDHPVEDAAVQPDGRIIIVGWFTSYNGASRGHVARLHTDGSLDTSFNPGTGADASVLTTVLQPDGRIIIGGYFFSYGGAPRKGIARLQADGSLDISFDPGTGATLSTAVRSSALRSDGRIITGGDFTLYNGTGRNRIARLQADGALDGTFNPGTGANNDLYTTALQPDGRIVIGGAFTSYNGTWHNSIARLGTNGALDSTFHPGTGANYGIHTTTLQPDGKIFIGGEFTLFNGSACGHIARLNADGSLDTLFDPGGGAPISVYTSALQPDGGIIIGGSFTSYNGSSRGRIARLNADGSLDHAFNPGSGSNYEIHTTALQTDGKVIIGGSFFMYNGTWRSHIARLSPNGALDASFDPGTGAHGTVLIAALQQDGKIIIGGWFDQYDGMPRNHIARLNADGSLDTTFDPGTGADLVVRTVVLQPDGRILIGGDFTTYDGTSRNRIARLEPDGSLDTTYDPGSGASGPVHTITLQPDSKVIIGGGFTQYNGFGRNRIARVNGDTLIASLPHTGTSPQTIFPNPTEGPIRFTGVPPAARTMRVIDLRGAVVLTMPAAMELDLTPLAAGVYNVQVMDMHGGILFRTTVIRE